MFGKKAIAPVLLIVISLALLVINLIELKKGNSALWGIVSNILLIVAMVAVIREKKSKR
ncbi:MAG: hypothetical protein H2058_08625 [Muricauda sp.]|nr:hypothetical protein [Allomuricauda sp.]MBA4745309.1 hypothetical protein [Allomuricauda sp.]